MRSGEWTTYGDIAVVVHGYARAARAVGRAAATLDAFPNAERVIAKGGRIPAGWGSGSRGWWTGSPDGAAECRRRLEAQGVRFEDGRADPARHVGWEVLAERAQDAGIGGVVTVPGR